MESQAVPVFAGRTLKIRRIDMDTPWSWLARGWQDLRAAPGIGLAYGVLAAVTGYAITLGFLQLGWIHLVAPAMSGFLLVGPILVVGLYEVSRRREQGLSVTLLDALAAFMRNPVQIALMGVALMLFFFLWLRTAALLFFLYWGLEPPSVDRLVVETFFSARGWPFLVIGTAVGAVFAFVAYSISVVSVPMLLDHEDANVIEAIGASIRAVQVNFGPLLLWAFIIAVMIGFGLVTFYLGLIVTLPLVGHASWHAYRDLVEWGEAD